MSRIIKVRIWDKQDKIYYKLYENAPFNAFVGYKNGDASLVTHEVAFVENDNFIVEQYIGLKDINGVEIYESDVLEDDWGIKWIVVWDYDCWNLINYDTREEYYDTCQDEPSRGFTEHKYKVIGNIHE